MNDRDLTCALLEWYREDGRQDLPWREHRTVYGTWVSEIMLQQTRVITVLPRYVEWMARFPDVETLSAASEAEVLDAWAGLGYYRRARLLHRGARFVKELGRWPEGTAQWRAVPGVGEYTAGAICAQTMDEAGAVVDGNVERVLSRLAGIDEPARAGPGRRRIREASARLMSSGPAGEILQALMDLGALVCKPRRPDCESCPLSGECLARARGQQESIPVLPVRPGTRDVYRAHLAVRHARSVLLRPARAHEYAEGLWVFPVTAFLEEEPSVADALRLARSEGLDLATRPTARGRIRASITHHRVVGVVFDAVVASPPEGDLRKFTLARLQTMGLPRPDQRILELLRK